MNFLKKACREKMELELVRIETIYENRTRTFRIFKDSYIIYKDFLKNIISSIISAIIDILLFLMFVECNVPIFYSNVIARIISGVCDFSINKGWVFKPR